MYLYSNVIYNYASVWQVIYYICINSSNIFIFVLMENTFKNYKVRKLRYSELWDFHSSSVNTGINKFLNCNFPNIQLWRGRKETSIKFWWEYYEKFSEKFLARNRLRNIKFDWGILGGVLVGICEFNLGVQIISCIMYLIHLSKLFLIEGLYYKPEGRGFKSQWGHWIF
jgi:hypothetical protein